MFLCRITPSLPVPHIVLREYHAIQTNQIRSGDNFCALFDPPQRSPCWKGFPFLSTSCSPPMSRPPAETARADRVTGIAPAANSSPSQPACCFVAWRAEPTLAGGHSLVLTCPWSIKPLTRPNVASSQPFLFFLMQEGLRGGGFRWQPRVRDCQRPRIEPLSVPH